ncbi:MAG: cytochrome o ubiquinol oxidase subunit IV [Chlamydiales bacterium]|nr:cytochrome o ubiquinol oxidase subunit IV [Chlamydiales bacterium]
MHDELSLQQIQKEWHGSFKAYAIGFVASLVLTFSSFLLVITKAIAEPLLTYAIVALGLTQAVVQLLFFLHLGQEAKPRWESVIFYFMLAILLIVVLGTLWIMFDLDYRTMSGMTMETKHD